MEAFDFPGENETGTDDSVTDNRKMEPNQYDVTVKNWLTGVGAEKYLDIFRYVLMQHGAFEFLKCV